MTIYYGDTKVSGAGVQVDSALSDSSTRPVENKVVTEALEDVGYSTWQKPADWIDIRSGALPNSVYFLVGHSADYSLYPRIAIRATISNSGTYDVFIDGVKYATTASDTATDIDWETLALETGKTTTYPIELVTHIVRVTPTLNTNTIASVFVRKHSSDTGNAPLGVLWAHYNVDNTINLNSTLCAYGLNYQPYLVAVTAANDTIKTTSTLVGIWNEGSDYSQYCSGYIACLPTFESQNNTTTVSAGRLGPDNTKVKKLVLAGSSKYTPGNYGFSDAYKLQEIACNNLAIQSNGNARYVFRNAYALKRLPSIDYTTAVNMQDFVTEAYSLGPTSLDLSAATGLTRLGIRGTSTNRIDGLKALTVSNEAPFDGASPQINVSYTGLDRQALRQLFKSMPYNVGYAVVGSPTIEDGVASGFSNSDYLKAVKFPGYNEDYEFQVGFTKTGTPNTCGLLIGNNYLYGGFFLSDSFLKFAFRQVAGTVVTYQLIATHITEENVPYKANVKRVGNTITMTIFKNGVLDETITGDLTGVTASSNIDYITIGRNIAGAFTGSIDLNNTYIKVNGVPWFTGKAAMTKTCNIVGCTGTVDLTQEDKNIALDKGWELTVA